MLHKFNHAHTHYNVEPSSVVQIQSKSLHVYVVDSITVHFCFPELIYKNTASSDFSEYCLAIIAVLTYQHQLNKQKSHQNMLSTMDIYEYIQKLKFEIKVTARPYFLSLHKDRIHFCYLIDSGGCCILSTKFPDLWQQNYSLCHYFHIAFFPTCLSLCKYPLPFSNQDTVHVITGLEFTCEL